MMREREEFRTGDRAGRDVHLRMLMDWQVGTESRLMLLWSSGRITCGGSMFEQRL
jgi:hypothetical protein